MPVLNRYFWMDVVAGAVWLLATLVFFFFYECKFLAWVSFATTIFYSGWAVWDLRRHGPIAEDKN